MDLAMTLKSVIRSAVHNDLLRLGTASRNPNPYEYRELLAPKAFRILALAPGYGEEPLQGKLLHCNIESFRCPSFIALSYVWGNPTYERPFLVPSESTSGTLLITTSLEEALKRFRLRHGTMYIWADGICINQQDVKERTQQVRLMGQIYRSAARVVVWLGGDPESNAHEAFRHLKKGLGGDFELGGRQMVGFEQALSATKALLKQPYFQRVWVIQEAILGRKSMIYWGPNEIDLIALSMGLTWTLVSSALEPNYRDACSWTSAICRQRSRSFELFQVLGWIRTRKCADDRDRIYAILGLSFQDTFAWHAILDGLTPDYTISVSNLYFDVACRAAKAGALAPLLNAVHHGPELKPWCQDAMPSWMPKWNENFACDLDITQLLDVIDIIDIEGISEERMTIFVKGTHLDEITAFSRGSQLHPSYELNMDSIYAFWTERVVPLGKSSSADERAWIHLMFCDVFGTQIHRTTLTRRGFSTRTDEWIDELYGSRCAFKAFHWEYKYQNLSKATKSAVREMLRELHRSRLVCSDKIRDLDPNPKDVGNVSRDQYRYPDENTLDDERLTMSRPDQRPKEKLRGRRLFITRRGQIGLGPEAMRAGDIIVNFQGSQVPFVLRPQGSGDTPSHLFQIVGAAYIPLSMTETALEDAVSEGATVDILELR